MNDDKEMPAESGHKELFQASRSPRLAPGTKRYSVMETLLREGSLTCFEAVRKCHDYVLRSTVSDIQRDFGIRIDRVTVEVPNRFGGKTRCARYFVSGDQRAKARELLGEMPR